MDCGTVAPGFQRHSRGLTLMNTLLLAMTVPRPKLPVRLVVLVVGQSGCVRARETVPTAERLPLLVSRGC